MRRRVLYDLGRADGKIVALHGAVYPRRVDPAPRGRLFAAFLGGLMFGFLGFLALSAGLIWLVGASG
ncbi:MAG: hypothetical protein QNI84_08040 [Henriciella sp.]|nr:hypothetical protein [Henriciella sp.]